MNDELETSYILNINNDLKSEIKNFNDKKQKEDEKEI